MAHSSYEERSSKGYSMQQLLGEICGTSCIQARMKACFDGLNSTSMKRGIMARLSGESYFTPRFTEVHLRYQRSKDVRAMCWPNQVACSRPSWNEITSGTCGIKYSMCCCCKTSFWLQAFICLHFALRMPRALHPKNNNHAAIGNMTLY